MALPQPPPILQGRLCYLLRYRDGSAALEDLKLISPPLREKPTACWGRRKSAMLLCGELPPSPSLRRLQRGEAGWEPLTAAAGGTGPAEVGGARPREKCALFWGCWTQCFLCPCSSLVSKLKVEMPLPGSPWILPLDPRLALVLRSADKRLLCCEANNVKSKSSLLNESRAASEVGVGLPAPLLRRSCSQRGGGAPGGSTPPPTHTQLDFFTQVRFLLHLSHIFR